MSMKGLTVLLSFVCMVTLLVSTGNGSSRDSTQLSATNGVSSSINYALVSHYGTSTSSMPTIACPGNGVLHDKEQGFAYNPSAISSSSSSGSLTYYVYYTCQEAYNTSSNAYYTSTLPANATTPCSDNSAKSLICSSTNPLKYLMMEEVFCGCMLWKCLSMGI
jgi:hypothetical protein